MNIAMNCTTGAFASGIASRRRDPDASEVEQRLDDHHTAGEVRDVERDHLKRRPERVREGVPPEHRPLGQALESRHLDVVALEHLDHRRPHRAPDVRRDGEREREHRQDEPVQIGPRRLAGADPADRRHDLPEVRGEHDGQQRADDELGHRRENQQLVRHDAIEESVPSQRRERPEEQRQRDRDRGRHRHQEQRVVDAIADDVPDRRAVGVRHAVVTGDETLQPLEVPGDDRTVESELGSPRRDHLGEGAATQHALDRVAEHVGEREHGDRHDDQCHDAEQQPPDDEFQDAHGTCDSAGRAVPTGATARPPDQLSIQMFFQPRPM